MYARYCCCDLEQSIQTEGKVVVVDVVKRHFPQQRVEGVAVFRFGAKVVRGRIRHPTSQIILIASLYP